MTASERVVRRRRLVLGVLAGGPEHTAAIAARVRGEFYEVLGILADLRIEKLVERDGYLWRLERPRDEHAPADRLMGTCHKPMIGTPGARLEPVHSPVDNYPEPVHNSEPPDV